MFIESLWGWEEEVIVREEGMGRLEEGWGGGMGRKEGELYSGFIDMYNVCIIFWYV